MDSSVLQLNKQLRTAALQAGLVCSGALRAADERGKISGCGWSASGHISRPGRPAQNQRPHLCAVAEHCLHDLCAGKLSSYAHPSIV